MDKEKELLHKLLDGELSSDEETALLGRVKTDPRLKEEYEALRRVIDAAEAAERLSVPLSFTGEVMKRLSVPEVSLRRKVSHFFFGKRVLRWNMAAALATACLMVIIIGGILQVQKKGSVVSHRPSAENLMRTVTMHFYAPQAGKVAVAGDFNKWSIEKGLMKKESNGIWTLEVPLQPGTYHYMFVVDGEVWVTDPNAESYRDDGFGNKNAVLRVSL